MAESSARQTSDQLSHTDDRKVVFAAERVYLAERRVKNGLPPLGDDSPLWGLAFSGGGVRSATFCLGAMQALTKAGVMKCFDYLSTVSGGSYIGSCLSSLLSGDDEPGLDRENSPFTGLRGQDGYTNADDAKLGVRHQIHHLRTHGEYLIPRSRLLSRDVQRAVGAVLPGTFHTVFLFLMIFIVAVAAIHLVLTGIDQELTTLAMEVSVRPAGADEMSILEYVREVPKLWFSGRIAPPFKTLLAEVCRCWLPLTVVAVFGLLWTTVVFHHSNKLVRRFGALENRPTDATRSGWTAEEEREARFVRRFNGWSTGAAVIVMLCLSAACRIVDGRFDFLAALAAPLAFAVGGLTAGLAATHLRQSFLARRSWIPGAKVSESRLRRSLYASLRGACLYGAVASVAAPIVLIVLFSLSDLPLKFFWSLAALVVAYAASGKGGASALQLGGWRQRPLANIAVLLFLAFAFAQVSALLLGKYRMMEPEYIWLYSLVVLAVCLGLFIGVGVIIDANRISPHYFYRDRLTEAYLKTDARITRPKGTASQGMPLTVLRDCENLRLCDLGVDNGRGPYHLIVAAMNLSGSDELNRKSFLSEHFIFSRDFIGSRVTGWVPTKVYREGSTRLARAMTISAAAVGSAMGPNTFAAQAFVTTLLNARLGFWTENPWFYRNGAPTRPRHKLTFWPMYLVFEALGKTSARKARVNVSDGGHTGDNLGLLPLLQRRCETIVVCDAEADGDYTFGSFNNAVRMALTEENIEIDIDLTRIMERKPTAGGYQASAASVAVGTIGYPEISQREPAFKGRLVFIKSSVNRVDTPVHVANYAKGHPAFPHETTADQFFDDAQFEAYRALGECLGRQAVGRL